MSSHRRTVNLRISADLEQLREVLHHLQDHSDLALDLEWQPPSASEAVLHPPRPYLRRLQIREGRGSIRFVPVESIRWIEAVNQYVRLHFDGGKALVRGSITGLASQLDFRQFCRVHRSAIINLEQVVEVVIDSPTDRFVRLADGPRLPISKRYWKHLLASMTGAP